MTEKENVQIVQEMYTAFVRGDIPAFLDALAEDIDWLAYGPADIPLYGPRRGRDEVAQFVSLAGETLEIQQFEPREFIAQGDKVVALGYERGLAKATARAYELHWADVLTLRGGKVTTFRGYWDSASIAEAVRGS